MIDIVMPNNNEEEFIFIAKKLGYSGTCYLYNFYDYCNKKEFADDKIKIYAGILAYEKDINKIKSKLKGKNIFPIS